MINSTEFAEFWYRYPRRVGKLAAQRAYAKARTQATAAEILDGIERYIAHKPSYADFAHPSSWLTAGRWMDEYDAPVRKVKTPQWNGDDWYQECKREHGGSCELNRHRHMDRMARERAS